MTTAKFFMPLSSLYEDFITNYFLAQDNISGHFQDMWFIFGAQYFQLISRCQYSDAGLLKSIFYFSYQTWKLKYPSKMGAIQFSPSWCLLQRAVQNKIPRLSAHVAWILHSRGSPPSFDAFYANRCSLQPPFSFPQLRVRISIYFGHTRSFLPLSDKPLVFSTARICSNADVHQNQQLARLSAGCVHLKFCRIHILIAPPCT